ncbi:HPP family protein [Pseudomonas putida]|uniref:HPP family protein n=1 Tax=Pseudomonas putida TaxID=303 RepID=UPI00236370C5|nr:HPP family protein [Pseudomonas putida]MDD2054406.1 HPP family protein [Pseudomonas putida]
MPARWLTRLTPTPTNTRPAEWARAAIGGALATFLSVWLCAQVFDMPLALHLVGPLGASAVLLFAVSSGNLAQPWSILGSYLCATLVSLLLVSLLGHSLATACLAIAIALPLMCLLRCLHPPAAALTLILVMGEPSLLGMGWLAVAPVMLAALIMLLCALAYNNLTRVPYPKVHLEPAATFISDPAPGDPAGITAQDLEKALAQMPEFIDITQENLEQLIRASELHARRRSIGDVLSRQP